MKRAKAETIFVLFVAFPACALGPSRVKLSTMILVNNRDKIEWQEGLTVSALLERLHYTFAHIIVKIDDQVVPRDDYPTRLIPDGAHVWVIHLIAGG